MRNGELSPGRRRPHPLLLRTRSWNATGVEAAASDWPTELPDVVRSPVPEVRPLSWRAPVDAVPMCCRPRLSTEGKSRDVVTQHLPAQPVRPGTGRMVRRRLDGRSGPQRRGTSGRRNAGEHRADRQLRLGEVGPGERRCRLHPSGRQQWPVPLARARPAGRWRARSGPGERDHGRGGPVCGAVSAGLGVIAGRGWKGR